MTSMYRTTKAHSMHDNMDRFRYKFDKGLVWYSVLPSTNWLQSLYKPLDFMKQVDNGWFEVVGECD